MDQDVKEGWIKIADMMLHTSKTIKFKFSMVCLVGQLNSLTSAKIRQTTNLSVGDFMQNLNK